MGSKKKTPVFPVLDDDDAEEEPSELDKQINDELEQCIVDDLQATRIRLEAEVQQLEQTVHTLRTDLAIERANAEGYRSAMDDVSRRQTQQLEAVIEVALRRIRA
jgi:ABC-type phosphate transport system auxiliary subunit